MAYVALLALGALDAAGYSVIAPVVPAIAAETGAGPGAMGALVAVFAVGMAAGFALAGQGIQRRHAGPVLAAALALMAIGSLGFILFDGLLAYFLGRLVMGVGSGGLWIGVTFAVLERFPGQEYRRLTGVLAAYSIGSISGAGLGAIGGVRGPFAAYLGLVLGAAVVVRLLGAPQRRAAFASDRSALRTRSFALASAAIVLVALALGTIEGPLPVHFSELLSQREIAGLYVGTAVMIAASATAAGYLQPRPVLLASVVFMVAGIALAGVGLSVPVWIVALALAGVGFGMGEAGALGVLLESIGPERMVLAMVVWSQMWAVGYLAGPTAAGFVAEWLGFAVIGVVPLVAGIPVLALFLRTRPAPVP